MNVLRAWCVNGLFQMFNRHTVLRIPMPIMMRPLRMYVERGELVVILRNPLNGENDTGRSGQGGRSRAPQRYNSRVSAL